jgi:hypothetical protein
MLNIVTVNWRNYEGRGVEYTNVLFDSVRRNLEGGMPGRFIVFTDDPSGYDSGIETRPIPTRLEGWWCKLALFRPHLFPVGDRVLYFDLDTVITGSIDALAAYDGDFGILADFYRPLGLQSSVMAWEAGKHTRIWEDYEKAGCPMDDPGGDQAWIEKCYQAKRERLQVKFPGMFVSYKKSGGVIPDKASVVVFHGKPRPHEIIDGWVPQIWCKDGLSHSELTAVCNTAHNALMANVKSSVARDLDWFRVRDAHDGHVAIIGGGPSVLDMIDEVKWRQSQGQKIWFLNNAARVLGSVHADAQVILDARPENQEFITSADEYLIASQCDPGIFDILEGANVTLWHVNTPGMTELLKDEKDRYAYLIGGGTTVGMNAIALAYCRGYRKIHLYGFDSSYRGCQHHAYAQPLNDNERTTTVLYGNKTYICAPWMASQAQEFADQLPQYEADGCVITAHGSGLLQDIWNDRRGSATPAQIRANEIITRIKPGAKGAEIGVFGADLSRELLKSDPSLELIMVDSWEADGKAYSGDSGDWHATLSDPEQEHFMEVATKRVKFANGRARIIRKRSVEALADVPDASLDFVFIDADHSYEGCKADIEGWSRKVRPGGLLAGHDYQNPNFEKFGVTQAVDEFASRNNLHLEIGGNLCWFINKGD